MPERCGTGRPPRRVRLWDTSTGKPIGLTGDAGFVFGVAFSPDGKTIASGGLDGTVRLWQASTGKPIGQRLTGQATSVWGVVFSPVGTRIASFGEDVTVRVGDTLGVRDFDRCCACRYPETCPPSGSSSLGMAMTDPHLLL